MYVSCGCRFSSTGEVKEVPGLRGRTVRRRERTVECAVTGLRGRTVRHRGHAECETSGARGGM